uniref:Uncharacterized protein n=1 Tax=Romanomermis culicivorax TaxID=13658 RepID=A0A915JSK6_ROMCU
MPATSSSILPPSQPPVPPSLPATFPAYSAGGTFPPAMSTPFLPPHQSLTSFSTASPNAALALGAAVGTKIMHPDEDVSLEEHRATFPKYTAWNKSHRGQTGAGSVKASLASVAVSNVESYSKSFPATSNPSGYGFNPMNMSGYGMFRNI